MIRIVVTVQLDGRVDGGTIAVKALTSTDNRLKIGDHDTVLFTEMKIRQKDCNTQ